jgi:signal transduction histidine kinase
MKAEDPALPALGPLEAYAALAAHQLGEAVALVRGASSLLDAQRGRLGPGGEDALRAMAAGADRAQRFVDDLLDLVRAAGELSAEPPASLEAALDAAVAELELPLRRVSLRREPLPDAALGAHDAQRVFVHLLRAALAAGAQRIQIGPADEAGDGVVVEVLDDGAPPAPGTDPFAPFGRPRGRGPYVGAGVGLVVCRVLAERHGGHVELDTADGNVLVTLHLPPAAG